MKKLFALLMALSLLLCACADKPADPTGDTQPTESTAATTEPTTEPTDAETEPTEESTEATEPSEEPVTSDGTNPLTGESEAVGRPYAVTINNDKKALPHWGTSQADMLWELPHEGNITRMLAIYTDVSDVPKVGPNRSARPYQLNLAQALDAIFVHAGGSTQAYKDLTSTGWDHLDGVKGSLAWKYFHRDQGRLNAGIALEHTMYTTGSEIEAYAKAEGIATDRSKNYGLKFAEDGTPDGEAAGTINISFRNGGKKTDLYYSADSGKYTMKEYGSTYTDANTGDAVAFENVLILETDVGILNDYGALTVDLVSSGDGYFACGGEIVPIRWSRSSTSEFFTFTLTDGTLLTLGVGSSYVAVVYDGAPVSYS